MLSYCWLGDRSGILPVNTCSNIPAQCGITLEKMVKPKQSKRQYVVISHLFRNFTNIGSRVALRGKIKTWNKPESSVVVRRVSIFILYLGVSPSIQQHSYDVLMSLVRGHMQRRYVLRLYIHLSIKLHQRSATYQFTKLSQYWLTRFLYRIYTDSYLGDRL